MGMNIKDYKNLIGEKNDQIRYLEEELKKAEERINELEEQLKDIERSI